MTETPATYSVTTTVAGLVDATYGRTPNLAGLLADYADAQGRLLATDTRYRELIALDPDLQALHSRAQALREAISGIEADIKTIAHQTGEGAKAHGFEVKVTNPVKRVTDWGAVAKDFPELVGLGVITVTHTADPKLVQPLTKSVVGLAAVLEANTVELPQTPAVRIVPVKA